jgi:4'-phosphopantetheinyl transferase
MDSTSCIDSRGSMLQARLEEGVAHPWTSSLALSSAFDRALPVRAWNPVTTRQVFVALLDLRDWRSWVVDAHAMLDPEERQRVERRRSTAQRDRLALAYALHRLLLARTLGCEVGDVCVLRDAAGCPRVPGTALSTSLSHADGAVALAVSASGPVGIDIEWSARAAVMPEIADRICHPDDRAAMCGLPWAEWNEALLALWVRKEAFLKAAGVGLQQEMKSFAAPRNATIALSGGASSRVRMLDAGSHWVAAVAAPPETAVQLSWLRPARACS